MQPDNHNYACEWSLGSTGSLQPELPQACQRQAQCARQPEEGRRHSHAKRVTAVCWSLSILVHLAALLAIILFSSSPSAKRKATSASSTQDGAAVVTEARPPTRIMVETEAATWKTPLPPDRGTTRLTFVTAKQSEGTQSADSMQAALSEGGGKPRVEEPDGLGGLATFMEQQRDAEEALESASGKMLALQGIPFPRVEVSYALSTLLTACASGEAVLLAQYPEGRVWQVNVTGAGIDDAQLVPIQSIPPGSQVCIRLDSEPELQPLRHKACALADARGLPQLHFYFSHTQFEERCLGVFKPYLKEGTPPRSMRVEARLAKENARCRIRITRAWLDGHELPIGGSLLPGAVSVRKDRDGT